MHVGSRRWRVLMSVWAGTLAVGISPVLALEPPRMMVCVGSYGPADAEGVQLFQLDLATGQLSKAAGVKGITDPVFLAEHPSHRFLYALGSVPDDQGQPRGVVHALAMDLASTPPTLKLLGHQRTEQNGPCHLVVDRAGRHVLVANYHGQGAVVLPIHEDGTLGAVTSQVVHTGSGAHPRQDKPHPHCIRLDPSNRFAFVPDLGIDKIVVYRFDGIHSRLVPHDPPAASVAAGAGPRHFDFHPNGRYAYVINELDSTITGFAYDAEQGQLTSIQTISTLPDDYGQRASNTTSEVVIHPTGRFLYGANRGHDSIAIFSVDAESGRLALIGHESTRGKVPRNFNLDPTGQFLLVGNQDSYTVVPFRVDRHTGLLQATGQTVPCYQPVCFRFVAY